jgi:hypothetical protein
MCRSLVARLYIQEKGAGKGFLQRALMGAPVPHNLGPKMKVSPVRAGWPTAGLVQENGPGGGTIAGSARSPQYLVQRRALQDVHCCLLIAPLRALVGSYKVPSTTEELWDIAELGISP